MSTCQETVSSNHLCQLASKPSVLIVYLCQLASKPSVLIVYLCQLASKPSVLIICLRVCQLSSSIRLSLNCIIISVRNLLQTLQQTFHCNCAPSPTSLQLCTISHFTATVHHLPQNKHQTARKPSRNF